MKLMKNLTWGSDPELHLFNKDEGRIVSAIPVLKNDKNSPIPLGDGINCYADNVLVEASFPPQKSPKEMVKTLGNVLMRIQEKLDKLGNFELIPQAAHIYEEDQLKDRAALEAGCSPNFDAYKVEMNNAPEFDGGLRTGSFHIHLGNKKLRPFNSRHEAIRLLDIFLGVPSVIFDKDATSLSRRKLYGKAGEFRPTSYGIEYRVLGNYSLRSPQLIGLVFDLVNHAMSHIESGTQKDVLNSFDAEEIQAAINNNNICLSRSIIKRTDLSKNLVDAIEKNYDNDMYKAWGF